jgi:hypothetical protein
MCHFGSFISSLQNADFGFAQLLPSAGYRLAINCLNVADYSIQYKNLEISAGRDHY